MSESSAQPSGDPNEDRSRDLLGPRVDPPVNPYAPARELSEVVVPVRSHLPTLEPPIEFQGSLQRRDLVRGLGRSADTLVMTIAIVLAMIAIPTVLMNQPQRLDPLWMILIYGLGPVVGGYYAWRQSGFRKASLALRSNPDALRPIRGRFSAEGLLIQTAHGWLRWRWSSVVGVRVRDDYVVLALQIQHLSDQVLPRHLFDPLDWQRVRTALQPLAYERPFYAATQPASSAVDEAQDRVANLDRIDPTIPETAIRLRGTLVWRDIWRGPLIWWMCRSLLVTVVASLIVAGLLAIPLWRTQLGWLVVAAVAIVPVLLIARMVVFFVTVGRDPERPLLRLQAAIDLQGLWIATPRGVVRTSWRMYRQATLAGDTVLLRSLAGGAALLPLARHTLVEPEQWGALVELATQRVGSNTNATDSEKFVMDDVVFQGPLFPESTDE